MPTGQADIYPMVIAGIAIYFAEHYSSKFMKKPGLNNLKKDE